MNKIEALNEKALEAARKAVKAAAVYDPVADVSTLADHAIRAYLTASDAEREPAGYCTKNAIDALLKKIPGAPVFLMPDASGPYSVPLYTDPLPLTDLEAENARLRQIISECASALGNGAFISTKCSVEFMGQLPNEIRLVVAGKDAEAERLRRATEARLAEALKALEPFALVAEHDISEDETDSDAFRPMPKPFNHAPQITVGHIRAALAVVRGVK